MTMCCQQFQNLLDNMGKKGLSAVLYSEMGYTYFCIQGRACDAAEAKAFEGKKVDLPFSIRLVENMGIQHCPYCGTKLEKWLARHKEEAKDLIKRSEPFTMKLVPPG